MKRYFLSGLLLFCMALLVLSCQEEELSVIVTAKDDQPPRFSLENFDTVFQDNLTIDWADTNSGSIPTNNARTNASSAIKWVEYDIDTRGYWTLEDSISSRQVAFKLLEGKTKDSASQFTLLKFLPANSDIDMTKVSYLDMKRFSGTVYHYTRKGKLVAVEGFQGGTLQSRLEGAALQSNSSSRMFPEPCSRCDDGGGGSYVWVTTTHYTDWYVSVNGGTPRYQYTERNGSSTDRVFVPKGYPSPSSSQHSHTPRGNIGHAASPHPNDITPSVAFMKSRGGCVYELIGGTMRFQNLVKDYDRNGGTVNLSFVLGQTSSTTYNAVTTSAPPFDRVTITMDTRYLASSARTIEIARTLFHEAIHAKIYSYLRQIGGYKYLAPDNFPTLYDEYVDYVSTGSKLSAGTAAQHEYMAKRYVDLIAKGVQQFDTRNKNNPEVTFDHYRALAWVGLTNTKVWNSKTKDQRDIIIARRKFLLDNFGAINCP